MQRIAICDPSDLTRDPLRNLLLGMDSVWMEAESPRYEFFPDVVYQSSPDVVIVALDSDQAKALQLISQLKAEHPGLPILAVSGRGDGQSILQALRAGAKEFLTQPVVLEELLNILRRLGEGGDSGGPKQSALTIAVLGSRGGVGCTSLAINLGCTLAHDKNHNVALIDLDLALGDADVALDLVSDHTLAEVAQNIERLDMQFLRRALCKHSTGLEVLPHPMRIEELGMIHEEHLQRLLSLLRASYTHLILDLSKSFTVMDLTALRMADVILLVTQLELTSIRNAVRILHTMGAGAEENVNEKVRLIVNRVGYESSEIELKKAEETIGLSAYWQIPNDSKALLGARNAGVPLVQHAPKCKAQVAINGLSNILCGKPARPEPAPGGSGLLSGIFGSKR